MKKTLLQTLVESFLAEDQDAAKAVFHQYSIATARKMMAEASTRTTFRDELAEPDADDNYPERSYNRFSGSAKHQNRLKYGSNSAGYNHELTDGEYNHELGIWTNEGEKIIFIVNMETMDQAAFDKVMARFFTQEELDVLLDMPGEMEVCQDGEEGDAPYDYYSLQDYVRMMKKVAARALAG